MYNTFDFIFFYVCLLVYVMQLFTNSIKILCCDIVLLGH